MRLPIICLDPRLGQCLLRFRHCFSKPQFKYFVTVLLGLMLCQGASTLSGVMPKTTAAPSARWNGRQVCREAAGCLSGVPNLAEEVSRTWLNHVAGEMAPIVEKEHARRRAFSYHMRGSAEFSG